MEIQPERRRIHKQTISFSNGNQAQAVLLSTNTHTSDILPLLSISPPHALIMIVGGAGKMNTQRYPHLQHLFADGIAHLATSIGALIIDGGTRAGVMEMMGSGIAQQQHRSPLLGVSPAGCVSYPGKPAILSKQETAPLDPNHSHFVLVETGQWGGETETMYELAQLFSSNCPSVAIVINGGSIAKKEVLYNVRQKRPIIILEGSGRAADEIAQHWHEQPSSISDDDLAEIIRDGNIHLFPLISPVEELVSLTQDLLKRD